MISGIETMLAAILVEQNRDLVIDRVHLPDELAPGQVFARVFYSGICGSQIGEIDGAKGPDKYLPHLLGHEASGEVLAVGPGVRRFQPGDNVIMHWRKASGIESSPPKYMWQGKTLNAVAVATFNEYGIFSENRLTLLPENLPMDLAPLFGCAITTGFGVVLNDAMVRPGEGVLVFGAGGVGLNVVQACAMVNAHPIVAVDLHDSRLELAASLGATHTLNGNSSSLRQDVLEIFAEEGGPDVAINNTPSVALTEMGYSITKPQGRVILVGVPRKGDEASIYTLPLHFGKTLKGSHGGDAEPEIDIPKYARLHTKGKLELQSLITERYDLSDINTAICRMRSGDLVGRCLVELT